MANAGHLQLHGLSLARGERQILNGIDLDFRPGSVHAIVGPNGAGKSTLANVVMGLYGYRSYDGDVVLDGESLKDMPVDQRAQRGVTLGWQEPARYEGLPVFEFILAGSKVKTLDRVREVLELVGLDPDQYMRRAVDKNLSGGERKRIELASIVAMEPRVVLMDEPDSGIDVEALNRIFDAIARLQENGATVILITHSLTVLRHAEQASLICNGKVIEEGPVDTIAQYFEESCTSCAFQNGRESTTEEEG